MHALAERSQVRGTTCTEIIQMAREAGAKRVYMASAAPPVRYPNVYGIDMPTKDELIANQLKCARTHGHLRPREHRHICSRDVIVIYIAEERS